MSNFKESLVRSLVPGFCVNYFQISNSKGWLVSSKISYLYILLDSKIYIAGILREKKYKIFVFYNFRTVPLQKNP